MSLIRRAQEKDIPRVLELLVQVNMVHHIDRPDLFKGPTTKYNGEELKEIFRNDDTPVFVFEDENGIVQGHCFAEIQRTENPRLLVEHDTFYIDDICVEETARGQHIASRLFAYAKEYAVKIGCYNITLNVWAGNKAARAFYESCGMAPQKTVMELILK